MKVRMMLIGLLLGNTLLSQSNLEIKFVGEGLDTSLVEVLEYEHPTVQSPPTKLLQFSNSKSNKKLSYKINRDRILLLKVNGNTHNLYVEPNDILYVSLLDDGSLSVDGSRHLENKVLFECFGSKVAIAFPKSDSDSLEDRLVALNSKLQYLNTVYGKYRNELSPSFLKYLKSSIVGYEYFVLSTYLESYDVDDLTMEDRDLYFSSLSKTDTLEIFDQQYSRLYMNALVTYLYKVLDENLSLQSNIVNLLLRLNTLISKDSPMYNLCLANILNTAIFKSSTEEELKFSQNLFYSTSGNLDGIPFTKKQLIIDLQRKTDQLTLDKVSDYRLTDIDGKQKSILSNNKQLLLVEFWASWCQPCLEGFDKLKTIKTKFPDLQINLINLSDSGVRWKKAVEKYNLVEFDENFHASKNESSILKEAFSFSLVPQYFLLNKSKEVMYTGSSLDDLYSILKEKTLSKELNFH